MVNFTISLLNVYKWSILMPRLQVNRLQMFLGILKQKYPKMEKNKQFIQKRMEMASLMKNHVNQYWINQRIMLRLESLLQKQIIYWISTLNINEETKFKYKKFIF
ncbi:unnamed protein product [Paramecium primaurelia]|uniref:Uncharacterized protein n=1 Tax=Paramecium primaurelia TaxID=5886 RepID=A0A8S1MMZ5_PARPR|nr:unnamed protein product [Paramecium primaurelia]